MQHGHTLTCWAQHIADGAVVDTDGAAQTKYVVSGTDCTGELFSTSVTDTSTLVRPSAASPTLTLFRLRSEEHTSELQSLMRISYAVFCLKQKITININTLVSTDYA